MYICTGCEINRKKSLWESVVFGGYVTKLHYTHSITQNSTCIHAYTHAHVQVHTHTGTPTWYRHTRMHTYTVCTHSRTHTQTE